MSQNYIAKRDNKYYVVVAQNGETSEEHEIKDPKLITKIEGLLAARRTAGEKITELLIDSKVLSASVHYQATIALGEGQAPNDPSDPKQE